MTTPITNFVTGKVSEVFPGRYEGEEVLIFVRRHWMAFIGWLLLVLIMLTIPVIVLISILATAGPDFFLGTNLIYTSLVLCIFLLVTNAVFLTAWVEHYLEVAIVTAERLIHISQVGLFNRNVAELSLIRIQDVSARTSGYIQTLLQYGEVLVETAGDTPNFIMPFVPKPSIVANTILTLHDRLLGSTPKSRTGVPGDLVKRSRQAQPASQVAAPTDLSAWTPPADYQHQHFNEDLITQKRELDARLAAERSLLSEATHATHDHPLVSPNRLPPPNRPKLKEQGELSEGEDIAL